MKAFPWPQVREVAELGFEPGPFDSKPCQHWFPCLPVLGAMDPASLLQGTLDQLWSFALIWFECEGPDRILHLIALSLAGGCVGRDLGPSWWTQATKGRSLKVVPTSAVCFLLHQDVRSGNCKLLPPRGEPRPSLSHGNQMVFTPLTCLCWGSVTASSKELTHSPTWILSFLLPPRSPLILQVWFWRGLTRRLENQWKQESTDNSGS